MTEKEPAPILFDSMNPEKGRTMRRFSMSLILVVCLGLSIDIHNAHGEDVVPTKNDGATLRGHVVDVSPNQNPIQGVQVEIVSSDGKVYTVTTDETGAYEQAGLDRGRYSINVHKKGYGSRLGKSKVVASGGEVYDRIKMRKNENIITFLLKKLFTWQLIVGFALGFLVALLLNSLHTRSEAR